MQIALGCHNSTYVTHFALVHITHQAFMHDEGAHLAIEGEECPRIAVQQGSKLVNGEGGCLARRRSSKNVNTAKFACAETSRLSRRVTFEAWVFAFAIFIA